MKRISLLLTVLLLAGCASEGPGLFGGNNAPDTNTTNNTTDTESDGQGDGDDTQTDSSTPGTTETRDTTTTRVEETPPPPPPDTARTPEQFDTTTPEQREEAVVPPPDNAGDGRLGTTVASIGAADEPGFWIKTPLVSSQASGRLFYPASGRTVQVQLIPSGGGSGSGSQVSLAALRLLDAPLDGLPELVVYQN